jgi:hypothetical protein
MTGMDLETFIAETLRSIAGGIRRANEAVKPGGEGGPQFRIPVPNHNQVNDTIRFDVAVTARMGEETSVKGGGRVAILSVASLGGEGESTESRIAEHVSRIQFSVHVSNTALI